MKFEDSFASHPFLNFFNQEENPGVDIRNIRKRSGMALNFRCPDCNHLFSLSPHGLKGCRYCANQSLCDFVDCKKCYDNSLASRYFTDLNKYNEFMKTNNLDLIIKNCSILDINNSNNLVKDMRKIFKSTSKSMYFICWKCNHSFLSNPSRVTDLKDCPYCSPKNARKLCSKEKNCQQCFVKSFASSERSKCWDYSQGKNQGKTPYDVLKSGGHIADLICDKCNHSFKTTCNNISSGFWCPFCAGQKRCKDDDCLICSSRKLSSHPMSFFWNDTNNPKDISPRDISLGNSHKKYWFDCPSNKDHPPFEKTPSHIARGQSCPLCLRKTEAKFGEFLHTIEPFQKEFTPIWLRTGIKNSFPRFDFALINCKIIFEIDGLQHFEEIGKWGDPIKRQDLDLIKMEKAIHNNYSGIRLFQPDLFEDKYDWKVWTKKALSLIKKLDKPLWILPNIPIYKRYVDLCNEKNIHIQILDYEVPKETQSLNPSSNASVECQTNATTP
jgi:hypothetical protein